MAAITAAASVIQAEFVFVGMANNLHISYDLSQPGRNYNAVVTKIKTFGGWARVHQSLWYVKSSYSAEQVADALWQVMDKNDSVFVVDSTNRSCYWHNIHPEVAEFLKSQWNK